MKKRMILIILCLVSLFGVSSIMYRTLSKEYPSPETNNTNEIKKEKIIDFEVYDQDLKKVKLADYVGKPIIVNFWTSWCPPCQREMPLFDEMIKKYGGDVTFLMINATDGERETMDKAEEYLKKHDFQFDILFDNESMAVNTYGVFYLPRTLFIDKEGYIVDEQSGELSEEILEKQINLLLQK